MKAELWKKIDELFAAAQAQPAEERAAFLERACGDDHELRTELESLLRAATAGKSFLEHPAAALPDQPALKPGDKLGAFEIVERIGRGGMGEVYRAHDPRLNRDVAIKVLPPDFARDPERLHRFQHEARAASALNHPNIVTVHEAGTTNGISWMATELVEGRSLRQVLAKGALPPRKAVGIAAQVADGLAAAHAAGIVHRDLKPENVMLTPADLVKILDFGIAKRRGRDAEADVPTASLTKTGEVVGTVTTMSPEQVLGKDVDHRSDIFSLGVVLYEMLSGKRPFSGDSSMAVMNAILSQEPADLPAAIPETLAGTVRRCLEKTPERRFQTAADLGFALRMAGGSQPHPVAEPEAHPLAPAIAGPRRLLFRKVLLAAILVAVAAIGAALWLRFRPAAPFRNVQLQRLTTSGDTQEAAISPDGRYVARIAARGEQQSIWLRQLATASEVQLVPPAENGFSALRFSRNGEYLYYTQSKGLKRSALYRIPSLGGNPELVLDNAGGPVYPSPDEKRFAYFSGGADQSFSIVVAGPNTNERKTILTRKAPDFLRDNLSWSPDAKMLAVPIGSFDDRFWLTEQVLLVPLTGRTPTIFSPVKWSWVIVTEWLPAGDTLLVNATFAYNHPQVWVVPYPRGTPKRVTNELSSFIGVSAAGTAFVTVQQDDLGEMWTTAPHAGALTQLTPTSSNGDGNGGIAWTPDGRLVYPSAPGGQADLWLSNADGTNPKRMTFGGVAVMPEVSPDGRTIYFGSERSGACHLWRMDLDGSNAAQVTRGSGERGASVTPDGKWLLYESFSFAGASTIWKMPLPSGTPVRLGDLENATIPVVSPDGQWFSLTYSDKRFEPPEGAGIMRLDGTGFKPLNIPSAWDRRWSADSKALYFVKSTQGVGNIWKLPVAGGAPVRITNFTAGGIASLAVSREDRLAFRHGNTFADAVLVRSLP